MAEHRLKKWLYTLLFPHKCFLCERVLADESWLCSGCCLPLVERNTLGLSSEFSLLNCVNAGCNPTFAGVLAPLYYENEVRRGMIRFKYSGRGYYAAFLAEKMHEMILQEWQEVCFDCVCYVPMHCVKRRKRGYSPAELLARALSLRMQLPLREGLLCHTGNKQAQVIQKDAPARLENARRSFAANTGQQLSGERVLLVDDILTTGATAQVCTQLLLKMGAGEVWVVVAAIPTHRNGAM